MAVWKAECSPTVTDESLITLACLAVVTILFEFFYANLP